MVFLSGNTASSPGFQEQLAEVRRKIENGLRKAETPWSKIVQVSAFVSIGLDQNSARQQIAAHLGGLPYPFRATAVAGFSSPEKLVEIEVTADLNAS
jgi:enamine deaminase RidA (YjgF/YER057c/UK114 family)